MLIVLSAIAAIVPMTAYLIIIWAFDKYDREPFKLVLANYLWGALGAILLAIIGSLLISTFFSFFIQDERSFGLFGAIVVAPFVEEITKGLFLLLTVTNRKFDNITDGIVYGGAIGLGFGMTENFFYFISNATSFPDWIVVVIIRTLFSAVMHCVSTATFGAFLGYAKFKSGSKRYFLPLVGIILAMLIHASWNSSISFSSTALFGFLFMILTVLVFIIVFTISVSKEKDLIYNELMEEAQNGLFPLSHLYFLSSALRDKKGWIPENIRKVYIKSATALAFRKVQLRNSNGESRLSYERDVNNYRNFIKHLLSTNS